MDASSSLEAVAPQGGLKIISAKEHRSAALPNRPLALITGAAKRLGAATARYLHRAGFAIAIHHHTSALDAHALAAELNGIEPATAFTLAQDLAAPQAGENLIGHLRAKSTRLDLLVNNASVFDATPLANGDLAMWEKIHAINVRTPYFLALAAAPMLRNSHGSIVNIADIHAMHPRHDYSMYCVSKAGLVAVTRSLALEMAPEVRVNCVAPGAILWATSEDKELRQRSIAATPLQRCGDPDDIAQAVHYLATAAYVTGQVINVDGGRALNV